MTDPASRPRAAVILAAGKGERMKSPRAKVMHSIGGRSMLDHAIDTALALGCARVVVVVGAHSPEVATHAHDRLGKPGVADAASAARHRPTWCWRPRPCWRDLQAMWWSDSTPTCPSWRRRAVGAAVRAAGGGLPIWRCWASTPDDPCRLWPPGGRVRDGSLERIVEAKDASPHELAIRFCNSGVMAVDAAVLLRLLGRIDNRNAKGEYFISPTWSALARASKTGIRVGDASPTRRRWPVSTPRPNWRLMRVSSRHRPPRRNSWPAGVRHDRAGDRPRGLGYEDRGRRHDRAQRGVRPRA